MLGADLLEHAFTCAICSSRRGSLGIDHVQQQRRVARLGERRLEGGHQLVRQLADESDGVGDDDRRAARAGWMRRTVGSSVAKS